MSAVGSISFEAARERFGDALEVRLKAAVTGEGTLFAAARYHLDTGGKRLRAILPPWLAANLGGDPGAAFELGVAFELIHNGTLVHDDLQDGDTQRRGLPTVWARYGMPQAVNVGTALLLLGLAKVLESPFGPRLIADVNLAILGIVEGQALEFELHADPRPTPAKWERMAAGKTGALFGACLLGGARAAGRGDADCDAMRTLGVELGVLFQLQDDLVDLVGDKGRERRATDLAEGKISWPVAWAAAHASADEAARLLAIVRAPRAQTSDPMIDEALALLDATGALAACGAEVARRAGAIRSAALSQALPGLVERVIAPVSHALPAPTFGA